MKKYVLCILANLASSLSFAQTKYDFLAKAVGHFCYQESEYVYKQALSRLQINADNICKDSKAIRVTEFLSQSNYCSVTVEAGFICENSRIYCKPKMYTIKCCDRVSGACWFE